MLNELSLFTGGGGGLLAGKMLGWRPIGYVEWDKYCQRIIRQRIKDGVLHNAPIYGDIRAFISDGYAASYKGLVDVLSAGFPCQPHSVIGSQKGEDDERDRWPETKECIGIIRPIFVWLENVTGIITSGYISRVTGDLATIGYDCRWEIISVADIGGDHLRKRWWCIAWKKNPDSYAVGEQLSGRDGCTTERQRQTTAGSVSRLVQNITWPDVSDPHAYGSNDGLANRVERTRTVGNGQVPSVAAAAWYLLGGDELI